MNLSPVFFQQLKNSVERILHVRGNYDGGILEMAVVIDHCLSKEDVKEYVPQFLRALKMHSEVFRNVRLNMVDWISDSEILNKVSPMSMVMLSGYYEEYQSNLEEKNMESLVQYLKLFQARSKVVILITAGNCLVSDEEALKKSMQPFLDKKMMQLIRTEDGFKVQYR